MKGKIYSRFDICSGKLDGLFYLELPNIDLAYKDKYNIEAVLIWFLRDLLKYLHYASKLLKFYGDVLTYACNKIDEQMRVNCERNRTK